MSDIRKITKLLNTAATSINDTDKTVVFRISDGKPDRQGEIVDQKSWDFKDYMANPLLITSHDASDIENGVGTAQELWYDATDDATYGRFKIAADASQKALTAWNLIKAGILRTVSVGFISKEIEYTDDGTPVLKNNELLETSLVLIPANPRAIALAYKERSINTKDARWLMDTMRKEADELETQLKSDDNQENDKSMDDVKSQLSTLTDAVTKLAEVVGNRDEADKAQAEKLDALTEKVEALETPKAAEDEKPVEPDDDKTEEPKDADKAPDEAKDIKADDGKADDDAKGDEKKSEEPDDSDAAKDGSDDQSGADADEFDEDAELTPELQAQIDEQLTEAASN